jgi:cbb3-type cytochrome oxidase subunit 3
VTKLSKTTYTELQDSISFWLTVSIIVIFFAVPFWIDSASEKPQRTPARIVIKRAQEFDQALNYGRRNGARMP